MEVKDERNGGRREKMKEELWKVRTSEKHLLHCSKTPVGLSTNTAHARHLLTGSHEHRDVFLWLWASRNKLQKPTCLKIADCVKARATRKRPLVRVVLLTMREDQFFLFTRSRLQSHEGEFWSVLVVGLPALSRPVVLASLHKAVHQKKQRIHGWREGRDKGNKRKKKNRGNGRFGNVWKCWKWTIIVWLGVVIIGSRLWPRASLSWLDACGPWSWRPGGLWG